MPRAGPGGFGPSLSSLGAALARVPLGGCFTHCRQLSTRQVPGASLLRFAEKLSPSNKWLLDALSVTCSEVKPSALSLTTSFSCSSSYSSDALDFETEHRLNPVFDSPRMSRRRLHVVTTAHAAEGGWAGDAASLRDSLSR